MKKRAGFLLASAGLVAGLFIASVQAAPAFKVTGGGQTDVSTEGGPGDTIAFTAQNTGEDDAARGQVQFVDREDGEVVEVYHGQVTCLSAIDAGEDGAARLAGTFTNQGSGPFEIYVEDNGEPNQGNDMIFIDQNDDPNCNDDDDDDDDGVTGLARGNVQVHGTE